MEKLTSKQIVDAFDEAEDEFGDHRSTEFLVQIVADRNKLTAEQVYEALYEESEKEK